MSGRSSQTASSFYSYSAKRSLRQEEVAAYRRIALVTILIVALLVGAYFLGIPLLGRLGAGSSTPVTHNPLGTADNIPPSPPRLDGLPDISRTRTIQVTGSAESGSTITISVNDNEQTTALSDKNGSFKSELSLSGGENNITATAKDSVGNLSRPTKPVTVVYDATPPKLLITSPVSQQSAVSTPTIVTSGKTDTAATLAINDRQIIVQPDGSFAATISLTPGNNTITIMATDTAGNTNKEVRTVVYTPAPQASASATAL